MISSVLYLEHILTVKTNVACKMKVSLVFGSNGALELNENEEAFVLCEHVKKIHYFYVKLINKWIKLFIIKLQMLIIQH